MVEHKSTGRSSTDMNSWILSNPIYIRNATSQGMGYKELETLLKEARCRLDSAGAARLISGGCARHTLPVRQTDS